MYKDDSEFTHSLDEEIKATKHDQGSNDQSQEVSLLGKSFSHVGQGLSIDHDTISPPSVVGERVFIAELLVSTRLSGV